MLDSGNHRIAENYCDALKGTIKLDEFENKSKLNKLYVSIHDKVFKKQKIEKYPVWMECDAEKLSKLSEEWDIGSVLNNNRLYFRSETITDENIEKLNFKNCVVLYPKNHSRRVSDDVIRAL